MTQTITDVMKYDIRGGSIVGFNYSRLEEELLIGLEIRVERYDSMIPQRLYILWVPTECLEEVEPITSG